MQLYYGPVIVIVLPVECSRWRSGQSLSRPRVSASPAPLIVWLVLIHCLHIEQTIYQLDSAWSKFEKQYRHRDVL